MTTLRRSLWSRHPVLLSAFVLALAVTAFFAVRMVMFTLYWADPAHRTQPPEPWMTPRYIATSWHLDPQALAAALQMPRDLPDRPTVERIAEARGVPVDTVLAEVADFIAAHAPRVPERAK